MRKEIVYHVRNRIELKFFQNLATAFLKIETNRRGKGTPLRPSTDPSKKSNGKVMLVGKLKQIDLGVIRKDEPIINNHAFVLVWRGNSKTEGDVFAAFSLSFWKGLSVKGKTGNEKARLFDRISRVAEEAARGE